MPVIRVPSGAATKPPAKPAPPPKAPPRITAPVRGPKIVANYAPPGKSDTAAPTAARGRPIPVPSYHAPAPKAKSPAPGRTAFTRTGNSLPLAAVVSPKLPSAVGRFLAHAAEDVPAAVKGTVIGAEALGKAGVQSVEHGSLTPLGHVLHSMWHNSIPQLLLEGAFQHPFDAKGMQIADQIKHDFFAHPVLSAMQVSPVGKLADLGRGAAADEATALVKAGEDGSDISTLHPTATKLHALPKVVMAKGSSLLHGQPIELGTDVGLMRREMINTRLDELGNNLVGAGERAKQAAAKQAAARMIKLFGKAPHDVKQNLTRAVIGVIKTPGTARKDLEDLSSMLTEAHARYAKGDVPEGITQKAALKATEVQQKSLDELLRSPKFNEHIQALFGMKDQHVAHVQEVDAELKRLGLLAENQAERRAVESYALTHIPGARMATEADKIPQHEEALAANKAVKAADANFASSREHYRAVNGLRGRGAKLETDTIVADARRQLANAKKAEASRLKFIQGRVGVKTPLKPGQYAKLDKAMRLTAQRQEELAQALARNKEERSFLQQRARNGLAAATQTKEDAHSTAAYLKPFQGQHYTGLVIDDGTGARRLTTDEIRAHMRANGVTPTAYVSGKLPKESEPLLHGWRMSRGDTPGHAYRGTSLAGLYDSSATGLHNSLISSVLRAENSKHFDRMIRTGAVYRDLRPAMADEVKREFEDRTGIPLTAVNQHAARLSEEQWSKARENQASDTEMHHMFMTNAKDINPSDPNARVALVPTRLINRLEAHAKANSSAELVQKLNRAFRNAILPWSPKWIAGNTIEGSIRAALGGARPGDAKLFDEVMKTMPKHQRDEILATSGIRAGNHFGFADQQNALASLRPEMQTNSDFVSHVRRSLGAIHSRFLALRNGIYHGNHAIEVRLDKAVAGARFRQWSKQWDEVVKKESNYYDALAKRVATPQMAEEIGHEIRDVMGQYNDFSPYMKRMINTFMPFGPWYMNAMKFVAYTLPIQHPLVNAALTAIGAHEQNYVNNAQPYATKWGYTKIGDLTDAIKSGDKYVSVARYLPEGAFDEGPVNAATSMFAPQAASAFLAGLGIDPYGNQLKDAAGTVIPNGGPQAGIAAINQVLTEFLPASNAIQDFELGGNTAAGTSTIWDPQAKLSTKEPWSLGAGAEKAFWPFRATDLGRRPTVSSIGESANPNIPGGTLKVPGSKQGKIPGGTLKVPSGR